MKLFKTNNLIIFLLAFIYTIPVLMADTWQECLFWLFVSFIQLAAISKIRWKFLLFFSIMLLIPTFSLLITSYIHLKYEITGSSVYLMGMTLDQYRLQTSLYLTIRATSLSLISFSFLTAISYDRLIYSLIQNVNFPVEWGYALFAAFNAVGKMKNEFLRIRQAAQMRNSKKPILFFYLIPLLVSATRYSQQAALSMQTRGLNKNKTFIINEKLSSTDLIILFINISGVVLITWIFNS